MQRSDANLLCKIIPLILFCISSTLINAWIPITGKTWLLLLVGCLICIGVTPKYFSSSQFIWCAFYLIIILINYSFGDGYFNKLPKIVNEIGAMVMMTAITYLVFSKKQDELAKNILVLFAIAMIITAIGTLVSDIAHPGVVRKLAEAQHKELDEAKYLSTFFRLGMSDYILPHGLPIMVPVLVYILKNKSLQLDRIWKILVLVLLLSSTVIVWLSGSTAVLLLYIMFLFIALMTKVSYSSRRARPVILLVLLILPLIISKELQIGILNVLLDITSDNESTSKFASHLSDLQNSLLYNDVEGAVNSRMMRYEETFSGLSGNVIWGTDSEIGGHAALLDRFATLGIIGIIPLIGFLFTHIKMVISVISRESRIFYIESVMIALIMMSVKNMFNVEILLLFCTITPLFLYIGRNNTKQI